MGSWGRVAVGGGVGCCGRGGGEGQRGIRWGARGWGVDW